MCRNGVPEQIDVYSKYCIKLYPENALLDISPEKLIGSEFCFPEREIRDRLPIQWEESPPQETTTERGVTGEIKLEEEPEVANDESYSLQEESLQGKESSDAAAKETDENMIETASKAGVTDRAFDLLKLFIRYDISLSETICSLLYCSACSVCSVCCSACSVCCSACRGLLPTVLLCCSCLEPLSSYSHSS